MAAPPDPSAEIGVFGGSGFYSLLDDVEPVVVDTPYGPPSTPVQLGTVAGRRVAFLARHGTEHQFPPHRIPYRANAWAMRRLGVRALLAPCASGSLQPHIEPGHLVVCDQLVDRTWGRADTFFDGPVTNHVSFADPYCAELGAVAADAAVAHGFTVHRSGTVVVVQGPRFSTRAESRWFRDMGWDVVNMTQHPEAALAFELGICYSALALITDYDAGVEGDPHARPVTQQDVFSFFDANVDRLRHALFATIAALPEALPDCSAQTNGVEPPPP